MKAARTRQAEELRKAGIEPDEHSLLPRIRLYDLRHTAASLLLAAGTHPKVASELLGHSTVTLTLDTYSHVVPSLRDQAADTMQRVLAGAYAHA